MARPWENASASLPAPAGDCPVEMLDVHYPRCGRPIHSAPAHDETPVCLMHSRDPKKHDAEFQKEFERVLEAAGTGIADFTRFVFPSANYSEREFKAKCSFFDATFSQEADFFKAKFTQDADFSQAKFISNACFSRATFTQCADFMQARFTHDAYFHNTTFAPHAFFSRATFMRHANFNYAVFTGVAFFVGAEFRRKASFTSATFHLIADFDSATFEKPQLILFQQINNVKKRDGTETEEKNIQGLCVRFLSCRVENVRFEDVNWYRHDPPGGRMLLQNELDLKETGVCDPNHELVAIAYRRLVTNFERARAYRDAEDCKIGAMEMERLGRPWHRRFPITLYKWASLYGSSYLRAFMVLLVLLLVFGVLFACTRIQYARENGPAPVPLAWRVPAGISHSFDVATFERDDPHLFKGWLSRPLTFLERILIPSQLALLLLALRRRFRT